MAQELRAASMRLGGFGALSGWNQASAFATDECLPEPMGPASDSIEAPSPEQGFVGTHSRSARVSGAVFQDPAPGVSLPQSRQAAFVCDANLHVLACNLAAVTLLIDGIGIDNGRVTISDARARRHMLRLLQSTRRDGGADERQAMLVPRPSGKVSFQLVLTPYNHGHSVRGEERRLWLVEIADPSDIPSLALQLIARLYHLTPAEARLAEHLLRGATVQEVAGATGVKVPTIRSQLSTLLRKTGTRRQAELIRMLSVVPA